MYVRICAVSGTLHTLQRPAAGTIAPRGLSGIGCRPVQRAQRPGVCVVPCVVCLASGTVCPTTCDKQAVRVRWGLGSPPAGYTATAQPRPVSLSTTEKIKKAQKNHPTPIANLKNSAQKQKDPYKGSVFCAILALQALKGRNLQWLKVK